MSEEQNPTIPQRERNPLIFISHDTRDAVLAEAFSKLLSSVSAGVLKSFRSSDKKGTQGIEYGVEWFPEIMSKLEKASDVVCLLTPNSIGRPWILYEAGVAKGKLSTPVHGIALGITLEEASSGPFAQFQNCDDDDESITSLVMQLVTRIPNAEPARDIVLSQVQLFKKSVESAQASSDVPKTRSQKQIDSSVTAKLFEEIKVMFLDLPSRIEGRISQSIDAPDRSRRLRRFHPAMLDEILHMGKMGEEPFLGLMIFLSTFRNEVPWLYEIAVRINFAAENRDWKKVTRLTNMLRASINIVRSPLMMDMFDSKESFMIFEELPHIVHDFVRMQVKKYRNTMPVVEPPNSN